MSSSDENITPGIRRRRILTVVNADNTSFLEHLVSEGLNSDVPTSMLSESDEEELCDFDGSDIVDPDYLPSDSNEESSDCSFHNSMNEDDDGSLFDSNNDGGSNSFLGKTAYNHPIGPSDEEITATNNIRDSYRVCTNGGGVAGGHGGGRPITEGNDTLMDSTNDLSVFGCLWNEETVPFTLPATV